MKFKIPQRFRLSTLLFNRKFTIALSVVLAFSLWLGISMTENPIRERTFNNLSATITLENTAASDGLGLGIASDVSSQKFSVTVSGPNYIVSSLRADDFSLVADTTNVNSPGLQTVKIVPSSNKSGFTINVAPATVNIVVDNFVSKEFVISPKLIGVSTDDGLIADTPIVTDSQYSSITIKGPSTTLEKIASVGSIAEVNNKLESSQTFDSYIVLYGENNEVLYRYTDEGIVQDANNNIVTNSFLTLPFTSVKVTQPIVKTKTVDCIPMFINLPDGMTKKDVKYTLSQQKVTVIGAPESIDAISSIELAPIDFREVTTKTHSFERAATLPSGVRLTENIESFTVDINVSDCVETTVNVKNIRTVGVSKGLNAKPDKSVRVTVCGPKNVIKKIDADDFYVVVDLTDKTEGTHNVEAVLKSDVYNDVWQIGTYTISVKLS